MRTGPHTIRILHVDDDPQLADMVVTFLEREDDRFVVETASDAGEGLTRLDSSQFDCVVSDYDMPGRNGIEFLEAVRADYPDLPFLLFTGKGSEEVASEAISAGVTDYLQKETGTEQYQVLANRIRNAVERTHAQTERMRQLNAIETANEGISILDEQRRFIYANQAYADLYGYDPEDLVGEHWRKLYRDEDIETIRDEILPTVESRGYWEGETIGVRADGTTFTEAHRLSLTENDELVCTVRDISDRVERERELERATTRLEALFENSPDMINIHDADGTIIDVNQRFCEGLDAHAADLVGRNVWEIDAEIRPEEFYSTIDRIDVGERLRLETEFRRDDGSSFPVEVHIVHLNIEDSDRFMVISRDITERREYERQLERERQFVQSIFDALPDPLYAFDTEGYLYRWNEQFEAVSGYSSEEIEEKHLTDFVADEDRETVERNFQRLLDERQPVTVEADVETKHGDRIPFELTGGPLESTDGTLRGLTGIGRDVTDRKDRERRLKTLNETAQDLMTVETRERVAEIGVDAARTVVGLEANAIHLRDEESGDLVPVAQTEAGNELVGDPPTFSEGDSIAWRAYESGETLALGNVRDDPAIYNPETDVRSELFLPLGEHGLLIAASESPGAFDQQDRVLGEILAGSLTTALDQAERIQQIRAHERELTQQNERLEEFAGVVSHDLRNPLNVAIGRLEHLQRDSENTHLDSIATALDRMDRIIQDVLWLAREGRDIGSTESTTLGGVVDSAWKIATDDVTEAEIHYASDDVRATTVEADTDRLSQLLENLFRNAVEHGSTSPDSHARQDAVEHGSASNQNSQSSGNPVEHGSTSRGAEADDAVEHGGVTVTVGALDDGFYVADDGPGIPPERRDEVFEAGYTTTDHGTGFGLRIVEQIAEAHGWTIGVTASDTGGARFEITGVETARKPSESPPVR